MFALGIAVGIVAGVFLPVRYNVWIKETIMMLWSKIPPPKE